MLDYVSVDEYDGLETCGVDYTLANKRIMDEFMNRLLDEDDPPTLETEHQLVQELKKKYLRLKYIQKCDYNKATESWMKQKAEIKEVSARNLESE